MLIGAISTISLAAKSRAAKTPHPLNFEGAKKVSQVDVSSSRIDGSNTACCQHPAHEKEQECDNHLDEATGLRLVEDNYMRQKTSGEGPRVILSGIRGHFDR